MTETYKAKVMIKFNSGSCKRARLILYVRAKNEKEALEVAKELAESALEKAKKRADKNLTHEIAEHFIGKIEDVEISPVGDIELSGFKESLICLSE